MKYAAASEAVIYQKKKKKILMSTKCVDRRGEGGLTAIDRKIKASMENVNDAVSHADMRRMRK